MAIVTFILKTLLGLLILVFVLMVCLLGLAIWSVPKWAPQAIDSWIESKTGFSSTVNSVDLKLFSGVLAIDGIALINPPYYQTENFMQLNQIAMQMQLNSLFKDRTVYDYVLIDIERITWVKNSQGSINVLEFVNKLRKKKKSTSSIVEGETVSERQKDRTSFLNNNYIIKKLIIKVGTIDMVGLPFENDRKNFALEYSKEFVDVTDIESIIHQVIADFAQQGVVDLTLDVLGNGMEKGVGKLLDKLNSKVTDKVQKGVEKVFSFLQKLSD